MAKPIKKEPKKKENDKKKKGPSLVAKVQALFAVGILFHLLAISYFKATIVYVLRFHCNLNENQSIMSFHMFQAATYFTTYLFGIIMSYSPMAAFILMLFFYLVGGVVMAAALIVMPSNALLVPLIPYAMLIFGIGVGAYKATIPKALHPESKSINSFFGCIFTELIVEIILVGMASLFLIDLEVFVFLGLYIVSFLMIAASSIRPMTDPQLVSEKAYKYANVINCSIYGVWKMFANYGSRLIDTNKEPRDNRHWLYRAEKKFGKDLVEALIIKFTLHKFYVWIAGVWIAVEVKYSYWIFTAYLSDRQLLGDMVFQPYQFLAVPPLIASLFIPCFAYWLAPALKRSYYNTGVRQMCLGAGFLLFSCGLGWRMSAKMAQASTEFMSADFGHTEVRILNGHFCPSGILHYFPMNLEEAKVVFPRPAIETAFPVTKANKPNIALKKMIDTVVHIINPLNEDTYLKYANLPFEDEEVGDTEQTSMQPTDSFTYLKKLDSKLDNAVTVESFGYCETLSRYTLDLPKLKRKAVDRKDVFLLRYLEKTQYVHYKNLEYKKSPLQKPGVRMYVVYRDNLTEVFLTRGGKQLCIVDGELKFFTDMIYLDVGDGPNLEVHALDKVVKFTHVLGPAEMIDLLVQVENGMVAVKMLYVEPPLLVSYTELLPQFILVTFGEFLVGVIGLQYFVSVVPDKMQYHVYMDWYLVLGFSNLVIIAATLMPWVLLHAQLSYLTMIAGASACFLIVMASRFIDL